MKKYMLGKSIEVSDRESGTHPVMQNENMSIYAKLCKWAKANGNCFPCTP